MRVDSRVLCPILVSVVIQCATGHPIRASPGLEILAPKKTTTSRKVVHVLGRTEAGNTVTVADRTVEVYATGSFAADNLPLKMGENHIEVIASSPSGEHNSNTLVIQRVEQPIPEVVSTLQVTHPTEDISLLSGDLVEVRAVGPPGLEGAVTLSSASWKVPLIEDTEGSGDYTAVFRVPGNVKGSSGIEVTLDGEEDLLATALGRIIVWDPLIPRVAEVQADRVGVTHGLHYVRLGGPYLAELPRGTRLEAVGQSGTSIKVRLSSTLTGWVRATDRSGAELVKLLPEGTALPHNSFTYFLIAGNDEVDQLSFSLSDQVAYSVGTRPGNELVIDFYNTHHATTWISRKESAQILGDPVVEQVCDHHVRVRVPVFTKQIWGFWSQMDGDTLQVFVRRPPREVAASGSALADQLIALEAGHGGGDSGAVGHIGIREKDVNLMAVSAIDRELRKRGARTILLRPDDTSPSLAERAKMANESGAVFLLSLHANAAGSDRGFLRVSGTSVYYFGTHCRRPAEILWRQMLGLGWNDFGLVGNFHYRPLRNTRVPAVLIEQAFMSHPGDETRLASPDYHEQQAKAIVAGLEVFFAEARRD